MKPSRNSLVLMVTAVALAGLLASLLAGAGQAVHWLPAEAPRALPASAKPQPLPTLSSHDLALTWQQSMFSPDRHPDLATGKAQATSLQGVVLTGVIINGDARWALLRMGDKHDIKLAVGKNLDNGWTLSAVAPLQATFTHQGQTRQLSLPVLRLPPPSKAPVITLPNVTTP
jgi:general secretion pathway protein N